MEHVRLLCKQEVPKVPGDAVLVVRPTVEPIPVLEICVEEVLVRIALNCTNQRAVSAARRRHGGTDASKEDGLEHAARPDLLVKVERISLCTSWPNCRMTVGDVKNFWLVGLSHRED